MKTGGCSARGEAGAGLGSAPVCGLRLVPPPLRTKLSLAIPKMTPRGRTILRMEINDRRGVKHVGRLQGHPLGTFTCFRAGWGLLGRPGRIPAQPSRLSVR